MDVHDDAIVAVPFDEPFSTTLVSYPERGPDGNNRYRGNTTGYIVRQFLATYHRDRAATTFDPMEGSGTTRDAAAALGIPYRGFDLREGFDAARHDLLRALGAPAESAFVHPPYAGMIGYSGAVWGDAPNAADLSRFRDVEDFHEQLQSVLHNVHRALLPGGTYAVLTGLWRTKGVLHDLPSRLVGYAPGRHVDSVVKIQNNVSSAGLRYCGRVVRIAHEVLHVFRRAGDATIHAVTIDALGRLNRAHTATWRTLVLGFSREHPEFTLADLYASFNAHPRTARNPHLRAKLRQVVNDEAPFVRLSRGRYALVAGRGLRERVPPCTVVRAASPVTTVPSRISRTRASRAATASMRVLRFRRLRCVRPSASVHWTSTRQ